MSTPSHPELQTQEDLQQDIARLIVESLKLEMPPQDIDPGAALFGEGLGLDSIDMLEVALAISKRYGVELRSENRAALASLRALTGYIAQHRIR